MVDTNISVIGRQELMETIDVHRERGWADFPLAYKLFANEYLKDYDRIRAAGVANISSAESCRLVRDPLMQSFMADLREEQMISTSITEDFVTTMWMRVLPKLMGEEAIPMVTADGTAITEKKFWPAATVSALREISKSTKFYAEGSGEGSGPNGGINVTVPVVNIHFSKVEEKKEGPGDDAKVIEGKTE